jgi:pimeloyl-ACP methyl ester carboxylesterase
LTPPSANIDLAVLLHCSGSSRRQWARLIASAPHLPMRAIDLYGYGAMPMPELGPGETYSLEREVELVEAAMDSADRVALVGHSFGAAVALTAAARRRSRIQAVVAHEPVMFFLLEKCGERELYDSVAARFARIQELVAAGRTEEGMRLFVDEWGAPGAFSSLKSERQADLVSRAGKIVLEFPALLHSGAGLESFSGLPALITYGEQSRAPAIRAARLLGDLYGGPVVIPGAGHMAPVTHPDEFNRIALGYLKTGIGASPA